METKKITMLKDRERKKPKYHRKWVCHKGCCIKIVKKGNNES